MDSISHHSEVKIPFRHNDRRGLAVVSYGRNEDPVKAGFDSLSELSYDSLAALGFDINLTIGYPSMHAWIETYEGYKMRCNYAEKFFMVMRGTTSMNSMIKA